MLALQLAWFACLPRGGLEVQHLAQALAAYALELLTQVGFKMFGSQFEGIARDDGSIDQVTLEF